MPGEYFIKEKWCVPSRPPQRTAAVIPQETPIGGVGTVFYNHLRTFAGIESPEIRHPLFGNNNVDLMLRMIDMGHAGNDP